MTDEARLNAAMAHIAAMRLLTTQDVLDMVDAMLRKFPWPHDTGAAADLQSCVYGLEETLTSERKSNAQYKPVESIPAPQTLGKHDRIPSFQFQP
jgi:hypothetical protein